VESAEAAEVPSGSVAVVVKMLLSPLVSAVKVHHSDPVLADVDHRAGSMIGLDLVEVGQDRRCLPFQPTGDVRAASVGARRESPGSRVSTA